MDTLKLEIVTPDGMIFSNDVKSVVIPGAEGELGILPRHASLITLLKAGAIVIEDINGSNEVVAINWGYAKIDENHVSILSDGAVYISGNNNSELAKSLEDAKELISSMSSDSIAMASTMSKIDSTVRKH